MENITENNEILLDLVYKTIREFCKRKGLIVRTIKNGLLFQNVCDRFIKLQIENKTFVFSDISDFSILEKISVGNLYESLSKSFRIGVDDISIIDFKDNKLVTSIHISDLDTDIFRIIQLTLLDHFNKINDTDRSELKTLKNKINNGGE